jgi:hypothetical protein
LCGSQHHLNYCPDFLKKNLGERKEFIKEKKLCFGCLKPNHRSNDCKHKMRCKTCQKNHPTPLHDEKWKNEPKEKQFAQANVEKLAIDRDENCTSMIVPVYMSRTEFPNKEVLVYALLDSQSDASFISEDACAQPGVEGIPLELMLSTMSSSEVIKTRKVSNIQVRSYMDSKKILVKERKC